MKKLSTYILLLFTILLSNCKNDEADNIINDHETTMEYSSITVTDNYQYFITDINTIFTDPYYSFSDNFFEISHKMFLGYKEQGTSDNFTFAPIIGKYNWLISNSISDNYNCRSVTLENSYPGVIFDFAVYELKDTKYLLVKDSEFTINMPEEIQLTESNDDCCNSIIIDNENRTITATEPAQLISLKIENIPKSGIGSVKFYYPMYEPGSAESFRFPDAGVRTLTHSIENGVVQINIPESIDCYLNGTQRDEETEIEFWLTFYSPDGGKLPADSFKVITPITLTQ